MTVYLVTGKLGSGKTLCSVGRLCDYLERGALCATNLDLDFDKLPKRVDVARVVRLPDKPSAFDLLSLGCGNESTDESKNGLIVLDECGIIFNSREWADKGRQAIVDWLLQSRKIGWDVLLIVQAPNLLDKQLREALCEMTVICKRLDRLKIPLFGAIGKALTFGFWNGHLPRVHIASVNYGSGLEAVHSDTWVYRGNELFGIYDTKQRFNRDYSIGPYSYIDRRGYVAPKPRKPHLPIVADAARLSPHRRISFLREQGFCYS